MQIVEFDYFDDYMCIYVCVCKSLHASGDLCLICLHTLAIMNSAAIQVTMKVYF